MPVSVTYNPDLPAGVDSLYVAGYDILYVHNQTLVNFDVSMLGVPPSMVTPIPPVPLPEPPSPPPGPTPPGPTPPGPSPGEDEQ